MAVIDNIKNPRFILSGHVRSLFKSLATILQRRRRFRNTIAQLDSQPDYVLKDIGISREDIPAQARYLAYGRNH